MAEARQRGVIFDIGYGMGSFGFDVARAMLDGGFQPDVISSDVHSLSEDGPAFDLLVTMSKMLCLGMGLSDVIGAATARPAAVLGRKELGARTPGSPGDAAVLALEDGEFDYVDAKGDRLNGTRRLRRPHHVEPPATRLHPLPATIAVPLLGPKTDLIMHFISVI